MPATRIDRLARSTFDLSPSSSISWMPRNSAHWPNRGTLAPAPADRCRRCSAGWLTWSAWRNCGLSGMILAFPARGVPELPLWPRERRAGGAGNARQGRGGGQQPCSQEVPISTSSSLPVHDDAAIRNVITRSIKTMDRATVSCPHFPRPGERPSRRVEPLGLVLRVGD